MLSDSAPPAIATLAWPSAIWSAALVIAWFAQAHARLTENAWTPLGSDGLSAISRAMFGASTEGMTVPKTSMSISRPVRLVRAMSSQTTRRPRSSALTERSVVPERAKGVRRPATIATRRPFPYVDMRGNLDGPLGRCQSANIRIDPRPISYIAFPS